ncbi:hypothetical protein CKO12_12110 [Chromatium okenii]|nr:hypothetical protein [Chromatium okenii]
MVGGEGNDLYWVDNVKDTITEKPGTTTYITDTVNSAVDYTLGANVENLILKPGTTGLKGTGNILKNVITGNNGDNYLDGKEEDDQLIGGGGDDTLDGGTGKDTLTGGDGSDTYMVTNTEKDIIVETAKDGDQDVVESNVTYTLGDYLEVLTLTGTKAINGTGNELDNTITGNSAANILSADAGDDIINAGAGNDEIDGGEGNDVIDGGDGTDTVVYQSGRESYAISTDDEGKLTVEYVGSESEEGIDSGVDEGVDSIINVETLMFADGPMVIVDDGDLEPIPVIPTVQVATDALSVNENAGTAKVTVSLSAAATQPVTVKYATSAGLPAGMMSIDGAATSGVDYRNASGILTFAVGDTSKTISVVIRNDTAVELNENFTVTLSAPTNATLGSTTATVVTIVDNDLPPPTSTLQLDTTTISTTEGEAAQITVSLSEAATQPVTVDFATQDVSAQSASGDYIATTGSLTFAPGETSKTISVATLDDTAVEQNETFSVQLSNPVNATLTTAAAVLVTIVDDTPQCVGTEADDNLTCSAEDNDIDALGGNDAVNGMGGNDTLIGNLGNDTLSGGDGNDQLLGGEGDDVLKDSNGDNNMSGGLGDDRFVVDGKGAGQVLIEDTGGNDTLDASGAGTGVTIKLAPGQISTVGGQQITLSAGGTISDPLDMYFLEDLTGSFSDDVETVQALVPNVVTAINDFQPDSMFGLGSFMDKPISPFGSDYSSYYGDYYYDDYSYQSDYVYANNLNLTTNQAAFSTALNALVLGSGNDWQESQLEALMQVALHSDKIGFRSGAVKTVVLMTDADYHRAGDGTQAGITTPNNGDDVLNGTPAGTGEDYPTVTKVAEALQAAGILPIFAVTSDAKSYYVDLVDQLGFGSVVDLTRDSSNLVTVITSGIKELTIATVENALGSPFADTITGDANANVLDGGAGVDQLTGGAGSDTFVFHLGDSAVGAGERDIIKDFSVATANEVIDLSNLSTGALSFIGTAAFSAAGQVRYMQDAAANTTVVQINLEDAVSVPEMEIQLTGKMTLTAADFVL